MRNGRSAVATGPHTVDARRQAGRHAGQVADEAAVSARGAAVTVGRRVLWHDVSFDVSPGEFVAVLGPNGVGKSTLIKAILGLLPLSAGSLEVLGQPPGRASRRIGYLPQRRSFDPTLRVRAVDVVRLGLDGDRWGVPLPVPGRWSRQARESAAIVDEILDLVGAGDYAHRPVGQLSGGEQQRVLIAQALVRRPDLLLLDEPLDSLDLPNQASVAALIARISESAGVSVMLVAHDVNPILEYLDRVVYVAAAGAVSGTPEQVITAEILTRLYRTPIEVLRASDGRFVVVGQPEAPAVHHDRHDHEH
jgi:zinc/manganese transport system ATP-binding protein